MRRCLHDISLLLHHHPSQRSLQSSGQSSNSREIHSAEDRCQLTRSYIPWRIMSNHFYTYDCDLQVSILTWRWLCHLTWLLGMDKFEIVSTTMLENRISYMLYVLHWGYHFPRIRMKSVPFLICFFLLVPLEPHFSYPMPGLSISRDSQLLT